jgi:hypothetical protein
VIKLRLFARGHPVSGQLLTETGIRLHRLGHTMAQTLRELLLTARHYLQRQVTTSRQGTPFTIALLTGTATACWNRSFPVRVSWHSGDCGSLVDTRHSAMIIQNYARYGSWVALS